MPGDGCELFSRFEEFWGFVVANSKLFQRRPLLHIADNWCNWRNGLGPCEKKRLETFISSFQEEEQGCFLELIRSWIKDQAEDQSQFFLCELTWLVLHQLSGLHEFVGWKRLSDYRRSKFKGIHAVLLPVSKTGTKNVGNLVKPLRVALVDDGSELFQYSPYKVSLEDSVGREHARQSLTSLLGGSGFPAFALCWALCGWTLRPSPTRIVAGLSGGIALLAAAFLCVWLPLPKSLVTPSLWIVAGGGCFLVAIGAGAMIYEWSSARRHLQRLQHATGVIVLGNCNPGDEPSVIDNSYAVSLYLATLQALCRHDPADRSALSWCTRALRKRRDVIAFTGALTPSGKAQPVNRVDEKAQACQDAEIEEFVVPWPEIPALKGVSNEPPKLRIRRFPPLVPLPIAAVLSGARAYVTAAAVTLMTIALALASVDAWGVLDPPAGPRILVESTGFRRDLEKGQDVLLVAVGALGSTGCEVRLNSRYWANRSTRIPGISSAVWTAELPLDKLDHPNVADHYDGELETKCALTFLGRKLRSVVVERVLLRHVVASP